MGTRTHSRKEIRQKLVELIADNVTGMEDKVFPTRKVGVSEDDLPCVLVYVTSERVERIDNINYRRTLKINIEIQTIGADEIEVSEELDDLSAEIEKIIFDNQTLGDLVSDIFIMSTEEVNDEIGSNIIGAVKMELEALYYTESVGENPTDEAKTLSGNISGYESTTELEQ